MIADLVLSIVILFNPCIGGEAPDIRCFSEDPETVARIHVEHHFDESDVEIMMDVAWCESRFVPTAANPTSSARGLFQLLQGWWKGQWNPDLIPAFDPFDINENSRAAAALFYADGIQHWNASRHCWG